MKKLLMSLLVLLFVGGMAVAADDLPDVRVSDLSLAGAIDGENITFDLVFKADVQKKGTVFPLVVGDVAYIDGTLPRKSELKRDGDVYSLTFARKGKSKIDFSFAGRSAVAGEWRRTSFNIPVTGIRKLSVLCDRVDLEIEFPGALKVERTTTDDGKLLVTAFLGVAGSFEIGWKPQVKKLDSELAVTCDANIIATAGVGALRLNSVLSYRVVQGRLRQLVLELPDVNVTQVRGLNIQDWHIDRTDVKKPLLIVDLSRPAESVYRLQIDSDMIVPKFPCDFELPVFVPRNVIRNSGYIMIGTDSAIKIQIKKASGVTQIDQAIFPVVSGGMNVKQSRRPARVLYAYQYNGMPYGVEMTADDVVTAMAADDNVVVRLAENEVVVTASFQIDIKDAPARDLLINVDAAAGWTVTDVSGRHIVEADVDIQERTDKRILKIPFGHAVTGSTLINVRLSKPLEKNAAGFDIPRFSVVGAKSERGYIVVAAEKGIRLRSDKLSDMREVHTGSAPMRVTGAQQAFRFREPGWKLSLLVERATPAIHCETFHLVSVGEGVAYYSAAISYHIGGAPVRELQVAVPHDVQSVEFTGADIEGWSRDGDICTVRFQGRVIGDYTLLVTYDRQFDDVGAKIDAGSVATVNTDSEVGYIAVASSLSMGVSEAAKLPSSVILIDRGEIPPAYTAPVTDPILRSYKIMKKPHVINVALVPYNTEQPLGQIADYVKLSTSMSKDGEAVTTANYYIKNAAHQYLSLRLPKGADLWSIRQVNEGGVPVDILSQKSDGVVLIPVKRPPDPNTSIEIEVIYAEKMNALGFISSGLRPLALLAPELPEAPVTFASWTVTIPRGFAVGKSGGNMQSMVSNRSGAVDVLHKAGMMIVAVVDGPGGTKLWDLFFGKHGNGMVVEYKKTVSLAGSDPFMLKLWVVPGWVGVGGSVLFMVLVLAGGVVILLACAKFSLARSWRALGLTLVIVGLAEISVGRSILVVLFGLVALWVIWKLIVRMHVNGRKRREARAVRREEIRNKKMTPPPLKRDSLTEDGDELFTPDGAGFARPALLMVICLIMVSVMAFFTQAKAETWDMNQQRAIADSLEKVALPKVVMDSVDLTIDGPSMDRDAEQSAAVTEVLKFEAESATSLIVVPANAVLLGSTLKSKNLEITSDADGYRLHILRKGEYVVKVKYQVPVVEVRGKWKLDLQLPTNLRNKIKLHLPTKDLEVSSAQAVLLRQSEADDGVDAEIVFGPDHDVIVVWQPRVRKTKLEKTLFFCEVDTIAVLRSGVIDLANLLHYQVAQGELSELKAVMPKSVNVISVEADDLATWSFDPASRVLEVILAKPVTGAFDVKIVTQLAKEGLPYNAMLGVPQVQGVTRQRGSLSIGAVSSVQLRMGEVKELSAMNIEDFSPTAVRMATTLANARREKFAIRRAYRYNNAGAVSATVSTEKVLPEIRVTESGSLSIADERIVLATKMILKIARAGLFSVELTIPADYEVESLTGTDVSHWDDQKALGSAGDKVAERAIIVHFNRRVTATTVFNLVVARMGKGIDPHITIPRVKVVDAKKHNGRFTVSGERGVRLMVESRNGVDVKKATEEGIRQAGVLVFDILRPSWVVVLKTEVMAPQIKPEVLQWVDLTEGMLQCRVFFRFKIENAGVNSFRLQLPYPDATLTVSGRNIAQVHQIDKTNGVWEVNMRSKVDNVYSMRASYQIPYNAESQKVAIKPLRVLGTDDQRGYLALTCGGRVQVTPLVVPAGLKLENSRNVPDSFGAGDLSNAVLCYRTLRPDYALSLSVVRHESAEVLPASIEHVQMTSVVSSSRRLLTKVNLTLTVGTLRFLKFKLPNSDDSLWTVLVNGKEATVSKEKDIYRIPLDQEDGVETLVEMIYAGTASSSRLAQRQKYVAPSFPGMPLKDIKWTFYVAPGLRYHSFGGSLTQYDSGSSLKVFSSATYSQRNTWQRNANIQKAKYELDHGEKLAKMGKNKEAQQAFQQALNYSQSKADLNEDARVQLRNLVKQQVKIGLVNRRGAVRQSQNIINEEEAAQMIMFNDGEYTQEYARQLEGNLSAKDNSALEVVANKMIDQQAAAAGEVVAIRISMPEDGKQLFFTRALQIDPKGELSVTFKAGSGWVARRVGSAVALLVIFGACWLVLAATRKNG